MEALFFSSRSKDKIIRLLFSNPQERYHMRQIERLTGERINSVREALGGLSRGGFITQERVGRKLVFQAHSGGLFYDEVLRMVTKQVGLGARLIKEKMRLGKIKVAFLTTHFYQKQPRRSEEIDLFVIGTISIAELAKLTKEEGEKLGIEINYSVMTDEEFAFRIKNKDPFLSKILQRNKLLLIGKEDYLL